MGSTMSIYRYMEEGGENGFQKQRMMMMMRKNYDIIDDPFSPGYSVGYAVRTVKYHQPSKVWWWWWWLFLGFLSLTILGVVVVVLLSYLSVGTFFLCCVRLLLTSRFSIERYRAVRYLVRYGSGAGGMACTPTSRCASVLADVPAVWITAKSKN